MKWAGPKNTTRQAAQTQATYIGALCGLLVFIVGAEFYKYVFDIELQQIMPYGIVLFSLAGSCGIRYIIRKNNTKN